MQSLAFYRAHYPDCYPDLNIHVAFLDLKHLNFQILVDSKYSSHLDTLMSTTVTTNSSDCALELTHCFHGH